MAGEWQEMSFSDAPLEIIDGDRGANYPKLTDFSSSGYCLFLNAGNVTINGFDFSECSFVDQKKDEALRKGKLQLVDSELGEIPKGWTTKTIADIAELNSWTLSKTDDLEKIEYIEISEVSKGNIGTIQVFQRGEEPSRARRRLRHGDTVLSTVRPERGSYFLCLQPSLNLVASTGFAVFTPTKVPWSLLHAVLTQSDLFEQLGHLADGGAYPAIRPEVIAQRQLPWPNNPDVTEAFHRMCGPLYEMPNKIVASPVRLPPCAMRCCRSCCRGR